MDVDPLQDTVPPRYAVESDEEDEINPLNPRVHSPPTIDVEILGNIQKGTTLVVATGPIATLWAKGAQLGEQIAAAVVNKVQIGLVFKPTWMQATIIVSESFSRLPLSFMHPYAAKIIESIEPSAISLLDSYSAAIYSSHNPVRILDAPIRYLATQADTPLTKLALFEPPNLLQSTSASFLTIATLKNIPGSVVLAPSAQIPIPAPKELSPSTFPHSTDGEEHWHSGLFKELHRFLFLAIHEQPTEEWHSKDKEGILPIKKRRTEVGEGGMYL